MSANKSNSNLPRIVLGTMTFGLEETPTESTVIRVRGKKKVGEFLEMLHAYGHIEIDTARVYGQGDTEKVLSQLPTAHFKIATKVFPGYPGAHDAIQLPKIFRQSLEALNATKVDIFYLHAPDYDTPFEVTLKAVDELYREGLFERLGLSNYSSWHVATIYEHCKQNGYVLPSVYQGNYNAINRSVVPELLPCLRHYNIAFYAFNVISSGLLSGKYKFQEDEIAEGSRFDPNTGFGSVFREYYWNKLHFEGVKALEKAAKANDLTLLEASLRWIRHHAGLTAKDAIILGVSNIKHFEENLTDLEKGPLPQAMIDAFDEASEHVKAAAPAYFRSPETPQLPVNMKKD
ncbi:Aldo/keto reductase [Gamsiella multidivaricata]|uniref:Aldo/keto reductase n=1 Tax=Gamsiella multidivaricata TaxID=101098 RepID=UPI0022211858|nr:Aldo/keto reductase [Gamsiella multidivaricata]XP_051410406.1 Aldo/keto reductase [Gamsiella multidivaricata]KAG0359650.1 hypothetical protein BGZ54_009870 [Gamsiella multidivaricata]KAI7820822.1 Aldo/keto reductase [Gamsiella multidivaricata]KAI7820824.1 Aldo/keto reductase [Gamsiella multidivaricata]